jgi:hypothetical protein
MPRAVTGAAFAGIVSCLVFSTSAAGPCFTAHPLPLCQDAMITRSAFLYQAAGNSWDVVGSFDLGYQRNLDLRSGWGAMAFVESSSDHTILGLRGRYRRWIRDDTSVDFEPGVALHTFEDPAQTPAFVGRVSLNFSEFVGIATQVECGPCRETVYDQASPSGRKRTAGRLRAADRVHFGSYPGAILPAVSLAVRPWPGGFRGVPSAD